MDSSEKEKFGLEKDGEGHLNYHSSGIPTDWRYGNPPPAGLVPAKSSVSVCPPVSMGDSFCPTLWDHPSNSSSMGFTATGGSANNAPIVKPVPGSSRPDMPWNPSDPLSKSGGMFPHPGLGVLPHGMPQFPPDSTFIERAAKFSCFGSGNFSGIMNTFGAYPSGPGEMAVSRSQSHSQKSEGNMMESSKELVGVSIGGQRSNVASPMNSQRDTGNSHVHMEAGEIEFSGSGQEEAPSSKALAARKRKKNSQEMEIDQAKEEPDQPVDADKEAGTARPKDEPNNSPLGSGKHNGKNAKDATEPGKEDYIHVRARRGQATNSHSLAERVRREKISERMKFLQDLVPGCSKVTGKAVMLDEIINYVQSLQRQVEFLSMKLAAVNPQIDFNIEGLLSKELLQSRAGASSTLGFTPDLVHPFLHSTSQGLVQPGNSSMGAPSDALRRAINAQLSAMNPYKEAKHQIHNTWDDELHNVISQMGLGINLPLNIQDSNDKPHDGFPM